MADETYRDAGSNVVPFPATQAEVVKEPEFVGPPAPAKTDWLLWGLIVIGVLILAGEGFSFHMDSEEE